MIGLTRNLMAAGCIIVRRNIFAARMAGGVCSPNKAPNPKFAKFQKLQEHFQKDDGKPIFLKGGFKDQVLYRTTWVLALIGLALQVKLFLYYLLL